MTATIPLKKSNLYLLSVSRRRVWWVAGPTPRLSAWATQKKPGSNGDFRFVRPGNRTPDFPHVNGVFTHYTNWPGRLHLQKTQHERPYDLNHSQLYILSCLVLCITGELSAITAARSNILNLFSGIKSCLYFIDVVYHQTSSLKRSCVSVTEYER